MRKVIITSIAIILIFSSFSIVSFAFMDHGAQHDCPVGMMNGGSSDCANMATTANWALHHISSFKDFTQTTVPLEASVIVFLLLASSILLLETIKTPETDESLYYQKFLYITKKPRLILKHVLRWLALRNKRNTDSNFVMGGYLA